MKQSYIFDFCTLFDMEQDAEINNYLQQVGTDKVITRKTNKSYA